MKALCLACSLDSFFHQVSYSDKLSSAPLELAVGRSIATQFRNRTLHIDDHSSPHQIKPLCRVQRMTKAIHILKHLMGDFTLISVHSPTHRD